LPDVHAIQKSAIAPSKFLGGKWRIIDWDIPGSRPGTSPSPIRIDRMEESNDVES
jgi:hypothetical protein